MWQTGFGAKTIMTMFLQFGGLGDFVERRVRGGESILESFGGVGILLIVVEVGVDTGGVEA